MNQINFTANFIKNTTVKKKDDLSQEQRDTDVAVVELDPNDENDVNALKEISYDWNHRGGKYIGAIYSNINKERKYCDVEKEHYYALTTQKDNFENLNPKDVLGVMLFFETVPEEELNELKYIEVEPSSRKTSGQERKYNKVGAGMVNFLINTHNQKPIYVYSDENVINFYRKMNFTNRQDIDIRSFYHEI